MFNVTAYLNFNGAMVLDRKMQAIPRIGDTLRFIGREERKVTEVIWCVDEPIADGQQIIIRLS